MRVTVNNRRATAGWQPESSIGVRATVSKRKATVRDRAMSDIVNKPRETVAWQRVAITGVRATVSKRRITAGEGRAEKRSWGGSSALIW